MYTGDGQRSKYPDKVIRYEQVRSCGSLLDILVKLFEVLHSLRAGD